MPRIIYLDEEESKKAGSNQPVVIMMPSDDKDKNPRRITKDERLFRKFLKMEEFKKKADEEKKKKDEAKNKPRTFTFLEVWGLMTISAIPLSLGLLWLIKLVDNAFKGLAN
jgi:hypothetical protein